MIFTFGWMITMNSKVVAVIISAMVIAAAGIGAFVLLKGDGKGSDFSNLDGVQIKNYSTYKYIGAGKTSSSSVPLFSNVISADAGDDDGAKMVGVTKDNNYEEISFVKKDGGSGNIDANLIQIDNRGFYSLLMFAESGSFYSTDGAASTSLCMAHETNDSELNGYIRMHYKIGSSYMYANSQYISQIDAMKDSHVYIMDNTTGNLYGFEELASKLKDDDTIYSRLIFYKNADLSDYCIVNYESNYMGKAPTRLVMKMSFSEDSMVMETVLNKEQSTNFGTATAVDVYGNIYRSPNPGLPSNEYVPTSGTTGITPGEVLFYNTGTGIFKTITGVESLRIEFDHKMYEVSGNQYQGFVNSNGEIEDLVNPFTYPQGTWFTDVDKRYCVSGSTIYRFDNVGGDFESFMTAISGTYELDPGYDVTGASWLDTDRCICTVSGSALIVFNKSNGTFETIATEYDNISLSPNATNMMLNVTVFNKGTQMSQRGYLDTSRPTGEMLVMGDPPDETSGKEIFVLYPINR